MKKAFVKKTLSLLISTSIFIGVSICVFADSEIPDEQDEIKDSESECTENNVLDDPELNDTVIDNNSINDDPIIIDECDIETNGETEESITIICDDVVEVLDVKDGLVREYDGGSYYSCYYIDGVMMKDYWVWIDGKLYYFGNDGKSLIGWQTIEGKTYYFEGFGNAVTSNFYVFADYNKTYYFDENGVIAVGWKKINSNWYYFDNDGVMYKEWHTIGGKEYYFDFASGIMQTGIIEIPFYGNSHVPGCYYFGENGAMQTGWIKTTVDDYYGPQWFYFDSTGLMCKGWLKLSGQWYYFSVNYSGFAPMATGFQCNINGKKYLFNDSGVMQTGWSKYDGIWYYCGSDGVVRTDWQKIDGKWYYFDDNGVMQSGGIRTLPDGHRYFFDDNGVMQTGWVKYSYNGKWYYFSSSGADYKGWLKSGGKWYYIDNGGIMATGSMKIDNKWYYFGDDGVMRTGWQTRGSSYWYYYDASGARFSGWKKYNNKWYYFDLYSGQMYCNRSTMINGKVYNFNSSGVCTNP